MEVEHGLKIMGRSAGTCTGTSALYINLESWGFWGLGGQALKSHSFPSASAFAYDNRSACGF